MYCSPWYCALSSADTSQEALVWNENWNESAGHMFDFGIKPKTKADRKRADRTFGVCLPFMDKYGPVKKVFCIITFTGDLVRILLSHIRWELLSAVYGQVRKWVPILCEVFYRRYPWGRAQCVRILLSHIRWELFWVDDLIYLFRILKEIRYLMWKPYGISIIGCLFLLWLFPKWELEWISGAYVWLWH